MEPHPATALLGPDDDALVAGVAATLAAHAAADVGLVNFDLAAQLRSTGGD